MRRRVLKLLTALLFIIGVPACSELTESLGLTAASKRGLVGNTIIFDDFAAGQCGINEIEVNVTGGSYSDSDVTRSATAQLTGIDHGYWNVNGAPIGTTVTVTTTDSYGQLQPASLTVPVESVTENIAPPQVTAPIRLFPARPGVRCFCDHEGKGGCEENLTRNAAADLLPAWSPDGGRIAFSSDRDGGHDIFLMNADGTGVSSFFAQRGWQLFAAWSPDGRRIAYSSNNDGVYKIFVITDEGGVTIISPNDSADDSAPTWSPDGGRIAFTSDRDGNEDIFVMNADGSGVTRLTNHTADDYIPTWSPDGGRIAFTSDRDGNEDIFVMNVNGTGVTRLTNHTADDWFPAWSPDGGRIAFTSDRDGNEDIFVMNVDGTGVTRLTNHPDTDWGPAWSPDGGRIAFTSDRDGYNDIFVYLAPK